MKKPYTVYPRRGKNKMVYYVRFQNPDGTRTTGKSTGQTSRASAEAWAIKYLKTGKVVQKENILLKDFANGFFLWEGPWAMDKRVVGKRLSKRQCNENTALLNNHIVPALGKMRLTDIDKATIKKFRNEMYSKGFAGGTINKVLYCVKAMLEAAEEQSLIQYIPRIELAANNPKQKGILKLEEVQKLFSVEWDDFRGYVANLAAMCTGLRRGELLALKIENFYTEYIEVLRSWDSKSVIFRYGYMTYKINIKTLLKYKDKTGRAAIVQ